MTRTLVDDVGPMLWSHAWKAQSCADQQHELAARELKHWQEGGDHPAFDAYEDLLLKCTGCKSVLEIGCGAGYYYAATKDINPMIRYFGMDISSAMIQKAKNHYSQTSFRVGRAEEIAASSKSFDLVVCGSVIGHCDCWRTAIREAFRVAKKWVMLHRVAVHSDPKMPLIQNSVKTAYGVEMAERILAERLLSLEFEKHGQLVHSICWSRNDNQFQASYLLEHQK